MNPGEGASQLLEPAPLLERESELARIGAMLGEVCHSEGRLLVLEGAAGLGKTRLLGAARALAAERGLSTLSARGSHIEREFGFGVVRQLFESKVRSLPGATRRRVLSGAAGLAVPVLTAGEVQQEATIFPALHGLFWLCVNLADQTPLLLAVDDAHWADDASLRWLGYLVRRLEDVHALVIITRRPAHARTPNPLLDALGAERGAEVLNIAPLSPQATADLTRASVGTDAAPEFIEVCHERSGGNPFLLHELLTASNADRLPATAAGAAVIATLRVDAVARSVLARLGSLSEQCRALATAVAVLETEVELHHAAAVTGLDLTDAAEAADALALAEILRPSQPLSFVHPLLRDAVHGDLTDARRAQLHLRAATVLLSDRGAVERVAAHLLEAPPQGAEWVVDTLRDAARTALTRGAVDPAIACLERAVAEPPPALARAAVLRELADALARRAPASQVPPLEEALELTTDGIERAGIARALAQGLFMGSLSRDGWDALERALNDLPGDADRELRLRMEAELLAIGLLTPSLAARVAQRVDALPNLSGTTPGERLVLANVARHRALVGADAAEVADLAEVALAGGTLLHEQTPESPTFYVTALLLLRVGRFDRFDALDELAVDNAGRRGSLMGAGLAAGGMAMRNIRSGDVRAAEVASRRMLELATESNWQPGVILGVYCLVEALIDRGALAEAEQALETWGFAGGLPDTGTFYRNLLFARGELRVAQRRLEEGLADLFDLANRERESGWHDDRYAWRVVAARGLMALGDRQRARAYAEEEVHLSRRQGLVSGVGAGLCALGAILGGEEGLGRLREAVAVLEPSPFRLEYARALADLGAALRRGNRRAEARELLQRALDLAHRCGADALEESVLTELKATGARPRRMVLTGVESLSVSERRVAEMAARGLGNADIAQMLFVTRKTVEKHLGSVYSKLDIHSRAQLSEGLAVGRAETR